MIEHIGEAFRLLQSIPLFPLFLVGLCGGVLWGLLESIYRKVKASRAADPPAAELPSIPPPAPPEPHPAAAPPMPPRPSGTAAIPSVPPRRATGVSSLPTPPMPPRPVSAAADAARVQAVRLGPKGLRPEQFPVCPYDRLMNRRGGPQEIFWDDDHQYYTCSHGHHFSKTGGFLS